MYNAFKASGISFNTPYTKRILKQYISKTAFGILYKQYNTYYINNFMQTEAKTGE